MSELNILLLGISSICLGIGVLLGSWTLLGLSSSRNDGDTLDYTDQRYQTLKEKCPNFQRLFRLVMELVPLSSTSPKLLIIQRDLPMGEKGLPWLPEEYLALIRAEGIVLSLLLGGILWAIVHPFVAVLGIPFVYFIYENSRVSSLTNAAEKRRIKIRQRLPLVVDLMAISMGAGSTFTGSMRIAVRENKGHPVGEEFGEALRQINLGSEDRKALETMAQRIALEPIDEMIFAVNKANELGVPLSNTLKEIASQMRLKVQQWGEKAAAEAQVRIVFPSVIIMVACMIVIVAPFVLPALFGVGI